LTDLLVIPDPHAHPEHDNDRFEAVGNYIVDKQPDIVVCLSDFADMPSLSSYDRGTMGFEGRRYKRDIEAVIGAQERLFGPINRYNKRKARNKEKQYKPRMVMTLGNHEDRINRVVNHQPELHGTIGIFDLQYEEFGWEVYPFLQPVIIHEIAFAHYFVSGVASRPISGENIGKSLIAKNLMSSIQGHSHVYDHSERSRADGMKLFGMSAGCFSHPEQIEGWNAATVRMWWHGVVMLEGIDRWPGYYESKQEITLDKLMREYL
jgi:hypothetical protein